MSENSNVYCSLQGEITYKSESELEKAVAILREHKFLNEKNELFISPLDEHGCGEFADDEDTVVINGRTLRIPYNMYYFTNVPMGKVLDALDSDGVESLQFVHMTDDNDLYVSSSYAQTVNGETTKQDIFFGFTEDETIPIPDYFKEVALSDSDRDALLLTESNWFEKHSGSGKSFDLSVSSALGVLFDDLLDMKWVK